MAEALLFAPALLVVVLVPVLGYIALLLLRLVGFLGHGPERTGLGR